MTPQQWQFWIDRGGTFTDIVACRPDGTLQIHKLLSEHLSAYDDAVLQGIRDLMGIAAHQPIPSEAIASVKMGTTVATNALLERQGTPTVLVITQGFRDALRIGYQNRPDIFAQEIVLPEMLYERVIEAQERYGADGQERQPLNQAALRAALQAAYDAGLRSCAIVLLHGYRFPAHEQQAEAIAQTIGFEQVSVSHRVSPLIKLVSRGDTTVVDAYLSPVVHRYLDRMGETLKQTRLLVMQSQGGLAEVAHIQGKDTILSGPAGGVVGAVKTAQMAGVEQLVGFDMGGTSTDVCHYSGEYERVLETEVAGVRLRTPMLDIHTVAAGGGSILTFDGAKLRVGPQSAGAHPGPACYRQGGPLTVTDCNVKVGKLQPQFFPQVFGAAGNQPLDTDIVHQQFTDLAQEMAIATGQYRSPEAIAQGFLTIAVENMARAIKKISLQRGHDLTQYTLCCFGSAGGQHACAIADVLGIPQILVHPFAGVLSAYGMGLADLRASRQQTVNVPLTAAYCQDLQPLVQQLTDTVMAELAQQGVLPEQCQVHGQAYVRDAGSDAPLSIAWADPLTMQAEFHQRHQTLYGFSLADRPLVIEALLIEAVGGAAPVFQPSPSPKSNGQPIEFISMYTANQWRETPVFARGDLPSDVVVTGPALIIEPTGTTVIEPHWQAKLTADGQLCLTRAANSTPPATATAAAVSGPAASHNAPDPIFLEVFNNRLMSIAEQMGVTLQNTSYSVNIKERLDFSCAIFDGAGQLVANAPHIPVHLGSMGDSVQTILEHYGDRMQPGEAYLLNDPYQGGTHLPDITVVSPVFEPRTLDAKGQRPVFYVASRGHHADIGGLTPGSMPSESHHIAEEGVLIPPMALVQQNVVQTAAILKLLSSGDYPARNPSQNLADLQAQLAANQTGTHQLQQMVQQYGLDPVQRYMQFIQDYAAQAVQKVIDQLQDGQFISVMDDGCQIQVQITVDPAQRTATLDFSGTSPQQPSNLNAPLSITKAVVLYVFRTLISEPIPLNAGCLRPLNIQVPAGSLLNPRYPAAVVAGNVETSQAIANTLWGALERMAAAQGTMNNLTFGTDQYQYYETICGGAGAGPYFHGADAVQTHMTNSRLTDPEVLENRFPVLVEEFAIRANSGGRGHYHGGNGVIRRLRFLEPMTVSILSSQRQIAPFGLKGGESGALGQNWLEPAQNLPPQPLPGRTVLQVNAGDCIAIATPGGGGYGKMS